MTDKRKELMARRRLIRKRYALTQRMCSSLEEIRLDQLELCADDMARRLILGKGRRKTDVMAVTEMGNRKALR
jgi:hypothetical protein